jgi:membrane protease subunit HflC
MINQRYLIGGGIALAILLILLINSLYIVRVDQQAILLQFGAQRGVVNADGQQAGLHLKVPFVQNIVRYDRRNMGYDLHALEVSTGPDDTSGAQGDCVPLSAVIAPTPIVTPAPAPAPAPTDAPGPGPTASPTGAATPSPQPTVPMPAPVGVDPAQARSLPRLIVDAFVRYRIADPLQFFRAAQSKENGEAQLNQRLQAAMRDEIGKVRACEIISTGRTRVMRAIRDRLQSQMAPLGVEVVDVRIRRADLPNENSERVFERMKASFDAQAQGIRATGEAEFRNRVGDADRTVQVTLAEAERYAQQVRGDGDRTRAEIYSRAYGQDPEFYAFYRSMQAYENAIKAGTPLVVSPDSEFFRYFQNANGR